MGSRGPLGRGQGHRPGPASVVRLLPTTAAEVPTAAAEVPPKPPRGLLRSTRDDWAAYWRSDVARLATEVDRPAVERYFLGLDEWRRAMRVLRSARLVVGSQGQPVMNPLAAYVAQLEVTMARLEGQLGLTPASRARLGLTLGFLHKTLEDLNREAAAGDDDQVLPDPRITVVDPAAADKRSPWPVGAGLTDDSS